MDKGMRNREPRAGEHGYDGACAPGRSGYAPFGGFSVGIFEWLRKSRGKGLKRGKTKIRVRGMCSNPQRVYDLAEEWCQRLDRGEPLPDSAAKVPTVVAK